MNDSDKQSEAAQASFLARMDSWMAAHPWHPRVVPLLVYLVLLMVIGFARDYYPVSYPFLYTFQCLLVCWLMWRYRKLTPELNIKFHWLCIPVGVFVVVTWIALGKGMMAISDIFVANDARDFRDEESMGQTVGTAALWLRLLGMSIVVPLFEELFIRSLMLRSLHRAKETGIGLLQVLADMPMIGDWVIQTERGRQATAQPPIFGKEFLRTPLGVLSVFGVCASTFVFMLNHVPRDWPGIWVCGVAYCWLLWMTKSKGLGPVVWAHGITNALLWVYTVYTGDWQFL